MRTALQRQITATVWQAIGFFGALAVLLAFAYFWGSGIEDRIDTVVVERHRDHRVLHQLVHEAQPVGGGASSGSESTNSGGDGGEGPTSTGGSPGGGSGGLGDGHNQGTSGGSKDGPKSQEPTSQGDSDGGSADTPTVTEPVTAAPTQPVVGLPETPKPAFLPPTLEAAGVVVQKAGGAVQKAGGSVNENETLCTVRGLSVPCP